MDDLTLIRALPEELQNFFQMGRWAIRRRQMELDAANRFEISLIETAADLIAPEFLTPCRNLRAEHFDYRLGEHAISYSMDGLFDVRCRFQREASLAGVKWNLVGWVSADRADGAFMALTPDKAGYVKYQDRICQHLHEALWLSLTLFAQAKQSAGTTS